MGRGGVRALQRAAVAGVIAVVVLTVLAAPASAAPKGTIAGTVTQSGPPVAGVTVEVMNATYGNVVGSTTTDVTGHYSVPNLNPNQFRVRFTGPDATYATMWSGGPTWSTATKYTVTAGATTTVDLDMFPATAITGTVTAGTTGIPGMAAVVLNSTTPYEAIAAALTAADGTYTVGRLAPGTYKVAFIDPAFLTVGTQHDSLRPEMFDDLDIVSLSLATAFAGAAGVAPAIGTPAVADGALKGIDCTFAPGTDLNGQDLTGANLKGCDLDGVDLGTANLTNANLHWAVAGPSSIAGATFANTICPDGTNSDDPANAGTCPFAPIVSGSPGDGALGVEYNFSFTTENAVGSSSVVSGSLPPGIGLSGTTLNGTPTTAGSYSGTIRFTNAVGSSDRSFSVTIPQLSQTVSFNSSVKWVWVTGPTYTPGASASSGLAVTFSIGAGTTNSACSIAGGVVTFDHPGTCEIVADQAGDTNYQPASASQTLTVGDTVGADCATVLGAGPVNGANLSGMDFHNCVFGAQTFGSAANANFYGADLTGSTISAGTWNGSDLTNANLSFVTITNATFVGVNGTGANLAFGVWNGANFNGASLVFANFTNTYALGAGANLAFATLYGATGPGGGLSATYTYSAFTTCATGVPAQSTGNSCVGQGTGW